jgi:hypothetical protein
VVAHDVVDEAVFGWQHELDGRPTDEDMARWLDYDKFYGLRDIPNCRRTRPPRSSGRLRLK